MVHAINNETYGAALARALYANLVFDLEEGNDGEDEDDAHLILMRAAPPSLDRVCAALLSVFWSHPACTLGLTPQFVSTV